MKSITLTDENTPIGSSLPDKEFVETREAILELLPRLFKPGTARWTDLAILEYLVDETVDDIGHIWRKHG